ncbi:MAG: tetratricopeptide repeat protein [Bacteroidia bacterium]|nr:tetratricopeptide repeat protein [Bacteroidota bacterium]MBP6414060.1 tetratricopeptide repeat protein [Bacteroidia bacterium]
MKYLFAKSCKSLQLLILLSLLDFHSLIAQNNRIDSLMLIVKGTVDKANKFELLNTVFADLKSSDPSRAVWVGKQQLALALELKKNKEIALAFSNIGSASYSLGNYNDALTFGFRALRLREELGNKEDIATSLSNLGLVYYKQNLLALAISNHRKALKLRIESNDSAGMATSYNSLGLAFSDLSNDTLALLNFNKALSLREAIGDLKGKSQSLNNIATVYLTQKNPKKALEFLTASMQIKQQLKDNFGLASGYDNIGDAYVLLAKTENNSGNYDKAISNYLKSLEIARALKLKEVIKVCCESLAAVYHVKGNDREAYLYYKEFTQIKDTLLNEGITKKTAELQNQQQEREITLLNKDKIIAEGTEKRQRLIIISGILFTIISLSFLLNRYYVKQRANRLLMQKNKLIDQHRSELKKQKEIIEQKNRDITDSIEYARNVQNLILPTEVEFKNYFPSAFVLYKPKSIVSGDFYWMHKTEKCLLIAAIDCTGHGIPGAMMSFLGYNLLENVVRGKSSFEPSLILKELNNEVFSTLSQKNENLNSKYGMDISLCAIYMDKREIHFAGAHHPLYLIRNGELLEFKGDKYSIGTLYTGIEKEFTTQQLFYQQGDTFYLFTDGYVDQIGGRDRKKYYYAPFKKTLLEIAQESMPQQKQLLEKEFLKWKGERDQTDDILILGFRL